MFTVVLSLSSPPRFLGVQFNSLPTYRCALLSERLLLITQFLCRISLQIGDSPWALFLYLCVNFYKINVLAFHFKFKFDQDFVQQVLWVLWSRLTCNLQIKTEELLRLINFAEVMEKSVVGFRSSRELTKMDGRFISAP